MKTDREGRRLGMDGFKDKNRPVLVFAPSVDDPRYDRQRKALDDQPAGLADREVVVLEAFEVDEGASDLRKAYRIEPGEFAVVLVGKDGGEKHRWTEPVSAQEIFGEIDAMPMRHREVHERRHGG